MWRNLECLLCLPIEVKTVTGAANLRWEAAVRGEIKLEGNAKQLGFNSVLFSEGQLCYYVSVHTCSHKDSMILDQQICFSVRFHGLHSTSSDMECVPGSCALDVYEEVDFNLKIKADTEVNLWVLKAPWWFCCSFVFVLPFCSCHLEPFRELNVPCTLHFSGEGNVLQGPEVGRKSAKSLSLWQSAYFILFSLSLSHLQTGTLFVMCACVHKTNICLL